jgi:hypothetical protein
MSEKISLKDMAKAEHDKMRRGEAAVLDTSASTPVPGLLEYTPPVNVVKLPSLGKVYDPTSPLFDTQTVDVRAMCAQDENILSSTGLLRSGRMLSTLMEACVVSRRISAEDMLEGDRNAIMVAIRNASYGPGYHSDVVCPACARTIEHEFDLSRLSLETLQVDPVGGVGNNLFDFTLPTSNLTVQFRLLTNRMRRELDDLLDAQSSARGPGGVEETVTQRLIHQIVSINGVTDQKQIARTVPRLPIRDSRALQGYIDKIEPGVEMKQEFKCPNCQTKNVVEVPTTTEFFWPKKGV